MKVVVTGGAGRLGSRVAASLVAAGHEVIASDVRVTEEAGAGAIRVVDLCEIEPVRDLVQGADVVCHLGNLPGTNHSGRSKGFINNTSANYNVFLAATEAGVRRMVYASSVQAYGCFGFSSGDGPGSFTRPQYLPLDEDHPLQPADAYPLSKATGESIAASFCRALPDLTAWSLRYTALRVPKPPQAATPPPRPAPPPVDPAHPRPKRFSGAMLGGMCTWIHIDDAVRATVMACSTDRPGHTPLNIVAQTSGPTWSLEVLADTFGPLPEFRRPVGPDQPLIAPDRAEQLLGFRAEHR